MEAWRDWAGLPGDILECFTKRIAEPKDFISFRAVCTLWRQAVNHDAHARFAPWVLKSEDVGESGNVLFYSMSSEKYHEIQVPALKGRRTRLAGFGAGYLLAIDLEDNLSAMLVNPLVSDWSTTLPRLPEWCRDGLIYGFAIEPEVPGGDVFVVVYHWWIDRLRNMVAMWRCGSNAGWATIPPGMFWPAMPQMSRLAEHGPGVMEDELAAADAAVADGDMLDWDPRTQFANLIEQEGKVHLLFPEEDNWVPFPRPRVSFTLKDMLGVGENTNLLVPVDWANAPELHGKIILQSWHTPCYVLPASDDIIVLNSKNCIYCFSWQHLEDGIEAEYCLCKWDWLEDTFIVVQKMPGVWDWAHGRWFPPTLKY